ncbi:MAG: hypothetical protein K6T71_03310, partial [Candidatus Bipolaricaulota bacterium]|nr:hypothetical protein [Candidatus Bipolaricaulota bacterium]
AQYARDIEQNIRDAYGEEALDEVRKGILPPLAERFPTRLMSQTLPENPITRVATKVYDTAVEAIQGIYEDFLNKAAAAGVILVAGLVAVAIIAGFYLASHREQLASTAKAASAARAAVA